MTSEVIAGLKQRIVREFTTLRQYLHTGIEFLQRQICHLSPTVSVPDQGYHLKNEVMKILTTVHRIRHHLSVEYSP